MRRSLASTKRTFIERLTSCDGAGRQKAARTPVFSRRGRAPRIRKWRAPDPSSSRELAGIQRICASFASCEPGAGRSGNRPMWKSPRSS
jgi:hypothetical protein